MPDIEFIFPNLDENSENKISESDAIESASDRTEGSPIAGQSHTEQLLSGIMDARYVSLENDNIDISQFPALRNALGLAEKEVTDSVFSSNDTDAPAEDTPELFSLPELPKEEPVPSIFAGIGRSDWTSFELGLLADKTSMENDNSPENSDFSGSESEPGIEEEPIDTDYLLDYIDDIEFSGMEAEPLAPVKIIQASDPYNSAFNSLDSEDEGELDEFEIKSSYIFEET